MFRKEIYLSFLLSISLFLIIDISSYSYSVLGQEDDNRDSHDNNVKEDKDEEEEEGDEKEEEDEVPFILPFQAVPFP